MMPGDIIYIVGVLALIYAIGGFSKQVSRVRAIKERIKKINESRDS